MTNSEAIYWMSQGRCVRCHKPAPMFGQKAMNANGVCHDCRLRYSILREVRTILSYPIVAGAK